MKCNVCGIDISGNHSTCPLCKSKLSGKPSPSPFPPNTLGKTSKKARMILGGITVAIIIAASLLCISLKASAGVVLAVDIILIVNYLFTRNIILHSPSVFRSMVRYFLLVIALAYIWYAATGNQHVIDYIIPGISITSLIFDSILIVLFAHQFVSSYSKYVLFNIAIGLVPLIFMSVNALGNPIPSVINIIISVITGLILCSFTGKQLKDELHRLLQH